MKTRLVAIASLLSTVACFGKCAGEFGTGPSPSPTETATPAASPTATATVTPSPTPNPFVCALVPSRPQNCVGDGVPTLESRVAGIQSTLPRTITTEAAYVAALVSALKAAGVCATAGTPLSSDEIEVKISNDFSEKYDVWLATNSPWLKYLGTCRPAGFIK